MLIMGFSSVLNTVLDPLFMFRRVPYLGLPGLDFGNVGAVPATVVSVDLSFLLGLGFLLSCGSRVRLPLRGFPRLDPEIYRKLMSIGLPTGAEMLTHHLAQAVVLKIATLHGTVRV